MATKKKTKRIGKIRVVPYTLETVPHGAIFRFTRNLNSSDERVFMRGNVKAGEDGTCICLNDEGFVHSSGGSIDEPVTIVGRLDFTDIGITRV